MVVPVAATSSVHSSAVCGIISWTKTGWLPWTPCLSYPLLFLSLSLSLAVPLSANLR